MQVYRNKHTRDIVLFFGKKEFEGIGKGYTYTRNAAGTVTLKDGDGGDSDSDEEPFWEAPPASTYGRVSVGTQTADSARDAQPPEPPVQIAAAAADILQASTEAGWNFGDFAAEPNTPTAASNDSFDMLDSDGL